MDKKPEKIEVLEGLEAVRKRPSMYIGSTDIDGAHHLIWEIVDNAVDESLAGFCDLILISIIKKDTVVVEDNGRGIPFGIQSKTKKSNIETVFTVLHSGGKFSKNNYKISGGLHGVGASVVNALSKEMSVEVKIDNITKKINFFNGGKIKEKIRQIESKNHKKHGTKITFTIDKTIFKTFEGFDLKTIQKRLKETAFLTSNLKIKLFDLREENNKKEYLYFYPEGIKKFLEYNIAKEKSPLTPFFYCKNEKDVWFECAFAYTRGYNLNIFSFCNNINTSEGGIHEDAFKRAFKKATKDYQEQQRKLSNLSKFKKDYLWEDLSKGLTVIFSLRLTEPEYKGQTKTKLVNQKTGSKIYHNLHSKIFKFFMENPKLSQEIFQKIEASFNSRKKLEEYRAQENTKTGSSNFVLQGKLTDCQSRNINENEIFIVEGDSAAGSARICRDRKIQAVLPLKGKIINVEKSHLNKIYQNSEIACIFRSLGFVIGKDIDLTKLRYGKIVIMTDADVDGLHIKILILTLFFRYFKDLITSGRVFIAQPPLYKVVFKGKKEYLFSDEELDEFKKKNINKKITIQRYKGLGEMNPDELWKTTMNPKERILKKTNISDVYLVDQIIKDLMGDDSQKRKEFIVENANFSEVEQFF